MQMKRSHSPKDPNGIKLPLYRLTWLLLLDLSLRVESISVLVTLIESFFILLIVNLVNHVKFRFHYRILTLPFLRKWQERAAKTLNQSS